MLRAAVRVWQDFVAITDEIGSCRVSEMKRAG